MIVNELSDTTVDENQPVEFTARTSGDAQVEWTHNATVLKNDAIFKVSMIRVLPRLHVSLSCMSLSDQCIGSTGLD